MCSSMRSCSCQIMASQIIFNCTVWAGWFWKPCLARFVACFTAMLKHECSETRSHASKMEVGASLKNEVEWHWLGLIAFFCSIVNNLLAFHWLVRIGVPCSTCGSVSTCSSTDSFVLLYFWVDPTRSSTVPFLVAACNGYYLWWSIVIFSVCLLETYFIKGRVNKLSHHAVGLFLCTGAGQKRVRKEWVRASWFEYVCRFYRLFCNQLTPTADHSLRLRHFSKNFFNGT